MPTQDERVKKHIVRLSKEERGRLADIVHKGKASARLVANKVVELEIVAAASDSTIGLVLKQYSLAPSQKAAGHPAESRCVVRSGAWG